MKLQLNIQDLRMFVVLVLHASTSSYRDPYSLVTSSMLATVTMALFEPLLQNKCSTGIELSYNTSIIKKFTILFLYPFALFLFTPLLYTFHRLGFISLLHIVDRSACRLVRAHAQCTFKIHKGLAYLLAPYWSGSAYE